MLNESFNYHPGTLTAKIYPPPYTSSSPTLWYQKINFTLSTIDAVSVAHITFWRFVEWVHLLKRIRKNEILGQKFLVIDINIYIYANTVIKYHF